MDKNIIFSCLPRLLTNHCAPEMFDLYDSNGVYSLDYNEDDEMLLQVLTHA